MPRSNLRVVIVGAGLAGPCLAHGLRKAGVEVSLYESEAALDARSQGYRIHIAKQGGRALRSCLPESLYQLAHATSGTPGSAVTVLSSQLEVVHQMTAGPDGCGDPDAGTALSVDRVTFRRVLLAGLEQVTHYATPYERFELPPGGIVRALFADGTHADADLLVGADGAGSRVRAQLLPDAKVVDTGQWAIFGKTPLTSEVRGLLPREALDGFCTVVGSGGRFLPLAGLEFRTDPSQAAAQLWPGLRFMDTRDYVMWVLGAPASTLADVTQEKPELDGTALRGRVLEIVTDWHPRIAQVIARCDPATVRSTRLRTAVPVQPWQTGPVTLMGDAIHCMFPAGIGAAVALQDAAQLAGELAAAYGEGSSFTDAVHRYEAEMLDYGFAAVAAAQQVSQQFG